MGFEPKPLADEIRRIQDEYAHNNDQIQLLRNRNDVINNRIREIYNMVRETPLSLEFLPEDTTDNRLKGYRCMACKNYAKYRCFWCMVAEKPCGFCDNHTHLHKRECPDHVAIFQRIFIPEDKQRAIKITLTPEQELAQAEARIAELKKRLGIE